MTSGPELLTISSENVDVELVRRAAQALAAGRLVALPTETVYGLGCDAFNEAAVRRVFAVKGRPSTDPLIAHVVGRDMLEQVVATPLPAVANELIEHFWPGPLTLVLPRNANVPTTVTGGLDTVAVRSPSHPVTAAIIEQAGTPIAAPSANRYSRVSPTSAQHVIDDLGDDCDMVVDSGRTERGLESTVVSIYADSVVILRHGAIPIEALQQACSLPVIEPAQAADTVASPGHDKKHYAPSLPTIAVTKATLPAASGALLAELGRSGVVYAGYDDRRPRLPDAWRFVALGSFGAIDRVARDLYTMLRAMDTIDTELIVLELCGEPEIGRAIDDRLTRAASSVIITDPEDLRTAIEALGVSFDSGPLDGER